MAYYELLITAGYKHMIFLYGHETSWLVGRYLLYTKCLRSMFSDILFNGRPIIWDLSIPNIHKSGRGTPLLPLQICFQIENIVPKPHIRMNSERLVLIDMHIDMLYRMVSSQFHSYAQREQQ